MKIYKKGAQVINNFIIKPIINSLDALPDLPTL